MFPPQSYKMQAPLNRMLVLKFRSPAGKNSEPLQNFASLFLPVLMLSDIAKGAKVARSLLSLQSPPPPRRVASDRRSVGPVVENVACTSLKRRR